MNDSWLRGDQWTPEEIAEMTANGLTPIEINALPLRVKSYIHDLETNADPAGTIQDLAAARDNVEYLTSTLAERDKVARDRLKEVEHLTAQLEKLDSEWSKKPPAKQGWYWYRHSDAYHPVPTFVEDCGGDRFRAVEVYEQCMVWLDDLDVEWWQKAIDLPVPPIREKR